jgi:hypothetical protein
MKVQLSAIAVTIVLSSQQCFAKDQTAGDVLTACETAITLDQGAQSDDASSDKAFWCVGYVAGVMDGALMAPIITNSRPVVCAPKGGTSEQSLRAVIKYLRDHPEVLHESAEVHVITALVKAFPCR